MRKFLSTLLIALFIFSSSIGSIVLAEEDTVEEDTFFSDIEENNRFYDAVKYLYNENVVEGYEDGTYKLYDEINRAEALKIILMLYGWIEKEETGGGLEADGDDGAEEAAEIETIEESIFPDVEETDWFYKPIMTAYSMGIISGNPDGYFYPEKSVNMAEALKMMIKASGAFDEPYVPTTLEENPAPDVDRASWYADYVNYALENGIVYLNADGNLNASEALNRGEVADILYRLENLGIYSGEVEYGIATWYGDAVAGNGVACGGIFNPDEMTAAHKTLPCGTMVRVTNLWNMETVEVQITDRGPYGEGRIIDLSSGAFEKISPLGAGVLDVEIEIIYTEI